MSYYPVKCACFSFYRNWKQVSTSVFSSVWITVFSSPFPQVPIQDSHWASGWKEILGTSFFKPTCPPYWLPFYHGCHSGSITMHQQQELPLVCAKNEWDIKMSDWMLPSEVVKDCNMMLVFWYSKIIYVKIMSFSIASKVMTFPLHART